MTDLDTSRPSRVRALVPIAAYALLVSGGAVTLLTDSPIPLTVAAFAWIAALHLAGSRTMTAALRRRSYRGPDRPLLPAPGWWVVAWIVAAAAICMFCLVVAMSALSLVRGS